MVARRSLVVVSAAALLLTGGPLVVAAPGVSPPAAAEDGAGLGLRQRDPLRQRRCRRRRVRRDRRTVRHRRVRLRRSSSTTARRRSRTSSTPLTAAVGGERRRWSSTTRSRASRTVRVQWRSSMPDRSSSSVSWGGEVTATCRSGGRRDEHRHRGRRVRRDVRGRITPASSAPAATPADFTWAGPVRSSRGAPNDGQTLTTLEVGAEQTLPSLVIDGHESRATPADAVSAPSDPANELLIEGESMVRTTVGTPIISQESTGNARLVRRPPAAGQRGGALRLVDHDLPAPASRPAGTFSVDMTTGQNFGLAEIKIDGTRSSGVRRTCRRHANALVRRYPLRDSTTSRPAPHDHADRDRHRATASSGSAST